MRADFNLRFYVVITLLISICYEVHAQNEVIIDSLKTALADTKGDSAKVYVLKRLSREYRRFDSKLAMQYANQAYKLAEHSKMEEALADLNFDIGLIHYNTGDYEKSQKYFLKSLSMFESLENLVGIGKAYEMVGDIKGVQGDGVTAINHYRKALKMFLEAGDDYWIAWAYNDIARSMQNADSSLKYHSLSLKTSLKINNLQGMADSYHNMAQVFENTGRIDTALSYYFKALALDEKQGNHYEMAISYNEIGELYLGIKENDSALTYLNKAVTIARNNNMKGPARMAYENLSIYYALKSDFKSAYEYFQSYSAVKDSMFNEEKSKELGRLEASYEFEKAETERARALEEKSQREKVKRQRRDNLQYSGILIFLVLIFASVFMLGKFSIPIKLAEGMIFFAFLLFFEFTLVMLDPYIDEYSSGAPAIKLAFNAILAGLIFPLHSFFETRLKSRLT